MSGVLAFIDTETTGLDPVDHVIWEIAVILPDGPNAGEHCWQQNVRAWMDKADPEALEIGRFEERYGTMPVLGWRESTDRLLDLLDGRTLVGQNPSFDEERFRRQVRIYYPERRAPWHYRTIDVTTLAEGFLEGQRVAMAGFGWTAEEQREPNWKSHDVSRAVGVEVPDGDARHTALGDARWAQAIFETVVG